MLNLNLCKKIIDENYEWAIKNRRHLHQHPELSFEEYETSKYISKILTNIGIPHINGIANTGILATIKGKETGKAIGIRADIDALPIEEENELSFKSINQGIMHACGHDIHTSILLYVAKILWENKSNLEGTVYLLFQPGEECLPGGASKVIESGILNDKNIEAFLALHVSPEIETGKIGLRSGMYMASGDEIHIEVSGKGGHAALPQTLNDTVLSASSIVVGLQQLVSRNGDSRIPSVLSIGKFIANGATNVIPSVVKLEGTFRTMNETWRKEAHSRIREIVEFTAKAYNTHAHVDIRNGYPCLINDPILTAKIKEKFIQTIGNENILDLDIRMTTEDFGYISNLYPSVFFRLGVGGIPESSNQLHSSKFIANEEALKTGTLAMLAAAKALLEN